MGVLSLITFLPLLGGILLLFIPKEKPQLVRVVALIASGAAFIASACGCGRTLIPAPRTSSSWKS